MGTEFSEGTLFMVPLQQGGYSVGVVARHNPTKEIVLAYFFGPHRKAIPNPEDVQPLNPQDAIKVLMVGYLGLKDGSWPIIGRVEPWIREAWPIPQFIRRDEISQTAWRVTYADENPNMVSSEEEIPYNSENLEHDSLYGAKAAVAVLSQLLV